MRKQSDNKSADKNNISSLAERGLKSHHVKLLLHVSESMAAFDTLDNMLSVLVDIATREMDAERGTIFLNYTETNELYSRIAHGNFQREIRILNNSGVAGHVFTTGQGIIVHDAYANELFNRSVDESTGFTTKSILCVPIRTIKGEIIGVAQVLNKRNGQFSKGDLALFEALTTQAAIALQSTQFIERMKKFRTQEMEFFKVVSDITSEIDLGAILNKVMSEATRMLHAERSTLFLNNEKKGELFSKVGLGLEAIEIRFPNHMGIAGAVFQSGQTINIPHAYADLRFNPSFDKQT